MDICDRWELKDLGKQKGCQPKEIMINRKGSGKYDIDAPPNEYDNVLRVIRGVKPYTC